MVTAQQVFDIAIHLMDEQNETNGATVTTDTAEYRFRALSILNSVIPLLYPYSGNYAPGAAGRPKVRQLDMEDHANPDMEQAIPLDDTLSLSCLPYYLAAQLMAGENGELANWFMNQYRMALADVRGKVPGDFQPIATPYGTF